MEKMAKSSEDLHLQSQDKVFSAKEFPIFFISSYISGLTCI